MLSAITRTPAPSLADCELTFLDRAAIDYQRALEQHQAYCAALRSCGVDVLTLPAVANLPDSVFVEDTALVLDECAVVAHLGSMAREPESVLMMPALAPLRPLHQIAAPATLEGGDVLRVGRTLYVGRSARTNQAGIDALADLLAPYGYEVVPVAVDGCLHLKTGCTALDDRTLLINPAWVDAAAFAGFEQIAVPAEEPWAANVLRLPATLIVNAAHERTNALLAERGLNLLPVDIGEFGKAEAGLTCLSLVFATDPNKG